MNQSLSDRLTEARKNLSEAELRRANAPWRMGPYWREVCAMHRVEIQQLEQQVEASRNG